MKPHATPVAIDTPDVLIRGAERLASDLAPLVPPGARIGIAVSGGPDSLALLLLAHRAMPGRMEAATVDHGLRPESAAEAGMVARLCEQLGIRHTALPVTVGPGNLQAEARRARYAALAGWARKGGLAAIATAHHADDQAETLLMRLNRGSGLRGLAAMRAMRPLDSETALIRPLLGWRREELAAICAAAGVVPADDPSNRDRAFDRVAIRRALAGAGWLDPARLAASASYLREDSDALDALAAIEMERCVTGSTGITTYRPEGPRAIRRRVLAALVGRLASEGNPRGPELARLLETLEAGGTATLSGVKARSDAGGWHFTAAPQRRT